MASGITTDLANDFLNYLFGGVAMGHAANLEFCLYTVAPGDAGGGTLVSTGVWTNYAHVTMARNQTNWPAADARAIANGASLDFGTADITGTPPEIVAVGARDATSDRLEAFATLATAKTINDGDPVDFPIGDLDWQVAASA